MARRPFFSGNYGSALGSTAQAADIIARAGQQRGQALANMGAQIGGMIQQYGLNKEKRAELTGEIEAMLPQYMQSLTMSGDEESDKKNMQRIEKFRKGDSSMADLKGLAGELAMKDKVQARTAQNEAARIANEMGQVNLGITKELKDIKIQLEKDKGVISGLAVELAKETNPQQIELLQAKMSDTIKNLGLGDQRRAVESAEFTKRAELIPLETNAEKARLRAVPKQVEQQEELGDLRLKAAKRADTSADLLLEAFGGAEGKAEFDYEGAKLDREVIKQGIEFSKKRGEYFEALSNKKVPVDTRKEYAAIQSNIGKIASSTLKDPQTGKQITFADYIDLNADNPNLYPLTGDNAGPAASLYGSYITEQRRADDLLKSTQVQVNVPEEPQVSVSASTPTNLMGLNYDYNNLDPSVAELMAGPGAVNPQITDPAIINILQQGGTFRGKNLQQLIAEGAIKGR